MIARYGANRLLAGALLASLALHFSAVTIFRIVFEFPRKDIQYFDIAIVPVASLPLDESVSDESSGQLNLSGPKFEDSAAAIAAALPSIELPALKFDELSMLRMRHEALETRSRYDELFAGASEPEPWSGVGRRLETISETFSRITAGSDDRREPAPAAPAPISRPAPGFEAFIDWLGDPPDRAVLAVQSIDALWGLSPAALSDSITLVFQVDRAGRVREIFDPISTLVVQRDARGRLREANDPDARPSEFVLSAMRAFARYKFEPLLGDGPPTQSGTLIVRAEATAP